MNTLLALDRLLMTIKNLDGMTGKSGCSLVGLHMRERPIWLKRPEKSAFDGQEPCKQLHILKGKVTDLLFLEIISGEMR